MDHLYSSVYFSKVTHSIPGYIICEYLTLLSYFPVFIFRIKLGLFLRNDMLHAYEHLDHLLIINHATFYPKKKVN